MANKTITAMFDTYQAAADAVTRLEGAGIPHGDISIVSNDATHRDTVGTTGEHAGTATGASLGTVLGGGAGLLAGLGMLAIPGLGPVVAAGWLAATLVGAGVGAAAGGIVGSLTDAGVSESDAHIYAEGINRGGTLVTVRADEMQAARVTDILDDEGTIDVDQRANEWRGAGWGGTYEGDTRVDPTRIDDPVRPVLPSADPVVTVPATGVPDRGVLPTGSNPVPERGRVRVYDTTI